MELGKKVKQRRIELGLTQEELAKKMGYSSRVSINKIEMGRPISQKIISRLATALNVSVPYLMGWEEENDKLKNPSNIPLYTDICCGNGLFVDDQIEDYIAIPDRYIKKGREYFANVASGDSMIGKSINDGDVLVFEKTNVLSNGDIGSFCIGDEYVCKVYRQLNNGLIILESANDKYEPIEIDLSDESQCFRIIGKLIATFKKY